MTVSIALGFNVTRDEPNTGRVYQGKFSTHFQPIVWIPMRTFQCFRVPMRSRKYLKILEISALWNQADWRGR
jgi:hypothetical protein